MSSASIRQYAFLATTTRVFALIALIGVGLLAGDQAAVLGVLGIGCIWLAATAAERMNAPRLIAITVEAGLVGAALALSVDGTLQILAALTFPPFTAGLRRGLRGALFSLAAELVIFLCVSVVAYDGLPVATGISSLTWAVFSLGLGLIGSFIYVGSATDADPLDAYRAAQSLIRELIGLSGGLSQGLEPVTLAAAIASAVHDELPVLALVVHVPRGDHLTPIINDHNDLLDVAEQAETLALRAWQHEVILEERNAFALPLSSEAGIVAVVTGVLSPGLDPVALGLHQTLSSLREQLEPAAVHLDTALLFAAFRDAATAEERRRLAREMHDGVAQEMASLGYLVDDMQAEATSTEQALKLQVLRERLSSVVGEVRRSVRTLRTSVGESESLGTAIGSLARHLGGGSGLPIQVTLDEGTQRLRPEVEAELLRIAQEAMTNAVRHSRATTIEVHCSVAPPWAEIIVSDDGIGVQGRREDSHGLEIMAERARLAGGELTVESRSPSGTVVSVRVGATRAEDLPDPVRAAPRKAPRPGRVLQP
jgi:signal transduction histidine kinase